MLISRPTLTKYFLSFYGIYVYFGEKVLGRVHSSLLHYRDNVVLLFLLLQRTLLSYGCSFLVKLF